MTSQEVASSPFSNSINDLIQRFHTTTRELGFTWGELAASHAHDIGRAGSVDYAQGMLVRLISMKRPRYSLPVVDRLLVDLHDNEL